MSLLTHRPFAILRVLSTLALLLAPCVSAHGQSTAPPVAATNVPCPPEVQKDRSVHTTIQAKVTGTLEASHLKPGKQTFVKVVYGMVYPYCTLDADSIIYGHVMASTSSKGGSGGSELSVLFDHGECTGHGKRELPLHLIGLIGPMDDSSRRLHDEMPDAKLTGSTRDVSITAADLTDASDENLNPTGPPHTIHPGIVVRMPSVTLEPQGGPACSARISSPSKNIQLGVGSELILTMSDPG